MSADVDCQPGTSVGTIRMLHYTPLETTTPPDTSSQLSSPRSGSLPSPPDSPISTSSFPSLSSSFFFSSVAPSPHHHPHTIDPVEGLVIPSLTLPEALPRPTNYGQALGDIKLLLIGSKDALSKTSLVSVLLEENEDVVDLGDWESTRSGRVLRASTYWVTQGESNTDRYEPANNIEVVELSYEPSADTTAFLETLRAIVQAPYRSIADVVDPDLNESYVLNNLLSSPSTPLYTAAMFLLGPSPTPFEMNLINDISLEIPLITHPRLTKYQPPPTTKLPSFRPSSLYALKNGLFRSPDTLFALRTDAADRFLRWRNIERSTGDLHSEKRLVGRRRKSTPWDKAQWEVHLEESISRDTARRRLSDEDDSKGVHESYPSHTFDPLHLPSIFFLSLSLLRPLAGRIRRTISSVLTPTVGAALVSGFCLGYGASLLLRA